MKYARINLAKTNYSILKNWEILRFPDVDVLENIYNTYCVYKKFVSVMPIFPEEFTDNKADVFGYFHNNKLVAFSLMHRYNDKNVEALQFAWDYADPELHLGIASLRNECAYYKQQGFDYLYLGGADEYKRQIDGFEILGPRT
ncbi:MAG: hypothetical protein VW270_17920 [Candidatus Poseidoniales archaeon]